MADSRYGERHRDIVPHSHSGEGESERMHRPHSGFHGRERPPQCSRREFLGMASLAAGAALLEASMLGAAQARAQATLSSRGAKLFDLEQVADGIYAALARPQAMINSNAAIFVNKHDVLVVDAHSKPSAVAALVAQLRREVTSLPVRYVVNSHFHWDHIQGDAAYGKRFPDVSFIASEATRQLMAENATGRLKQSLEELPKQIEEQRARLAKSTDSRERAFYQDQTAQMQAYRRELSQFTLELPDLTFKEGLTIHDDAHTLALSFQGRGHTAGDVMVFCPEKKAVATGDALIGFLPNIADGYPKEWPRTLEKVGKLEFEALIPGHGFVDKNRILLRGLSGYIEELTEKVAKGSHQDKTKEELQQEITVQSLQSLAEGRYADLVLATLKRFQPWYGTPPNLSEPVRANIADIYSRLDAA